MAYSCFSDVIVRNKTTIIPPPSTVSTVRARRFGVSASKSWQQKIINTELSPVQARQHVDTLLYSMQYYCWPHLNTMMGNQEVRGGGGGGNSRSLVIPE